MSVVANTFIMTSLCNFRMEAGKYQFTFEFVNQSSFLQINNSRQPYWMHDQYKMNEYKFKKKKCFQIPLKTYIISY